MKKRRKSHKGTIRVSKSGVRYRKSSSARTGWVRIGKKKKRATKRKHHAKRKRHTKRKHTKKRHRRLSW